MSDKISIHEYLRNRSDAKKDDDKSDSSKEAWGATADSKMSKMVDAHEKAADKHKTAAKDQKAAGNDEAAKSHSEQAKSHKDAAGKLKSDFGGGNLF